MQFDQGVRVLINKRSGGEPGFFVTCDHRLLRFFSHVEQDPQTDFSGAKERMAMFLDMNFPEGKPHSVTFQPADPLEMVALREVKAYIAVAAQTVPQS